MEQDAQQTLAFLATILWKFCQSAGFRALPVLGLLLLESSVSSKAVRSRASGGHCHPGPPSQPCPAHLFTSQRPVYFGRLPKPVLNRSGFPFLFLFGSAPLKKKKFSFVSPRTCRLRPQTARWEPGVGAGAGQGGCGSSTARSAPLAQSPHAPRRGGPVRAPGPGPSRSGAWPLGGLEPRRAEAWTWNPGKRRWSGDHGGGRGAARARRPGGAPRPGPPRSAPRRSAPPRPDAQGPGPRSRGARSSGSSPAPRVSAARWPGGPRRPARCAARAGAWRCWSAAGPAWRSTSCRPGATARGSRVSGAAPRPRGPPASGQGCE